MINEIPAEETFSLSKVKLLPKGGVTVDYNVTTIVDEQAYTTERKEICSREVHPDLRGCFEALKGIVAASLGILGFVQIVTKKNGAPEALVEQAKEQAAKLLEGIDVRGIALSGTGENVGIVITAVFETPNGLKTCINTPRIKLAQVSYGFEEELEAISDKIKTEVYQYLFKGKQAQLSLFGQDDLPGDGE